jgi:hypothetical protein
MHHKRGRPKNRRAGCLMCKPHKANGAKGRGMRARDVAAVQRANIDARQQLTEDERNSPECMQRILWEEEQRDLANL